jgi:hypothetical protein
VSPPLPSSSPLPPSSFLGAARRDPSPLLSLAPATAMAPFAPTRVAPSSSVRPAMASARPGARGPVRLGAAVASARPGSLPPRGVPDPLPSARWWRPAWRVVPAPAPVQLLPGSPPARPFLPGVRPPQHLPARRARRARPPRRAPLRGHDARARPRHFPSARPRPPLRVARPRLGRPRAPSSAWRARAASPAAQLPAPFGPSPHSGRHGAAWRVRLCPWRPVRARPPRVPRRGLELG